MEEEEARPNQSLTDYLDVLPTPALTCRLHANKDPSVTYANDAFLSLFDLFSADLLPSSSFRRPPKTKVGSVLGTLDIGRILPAWGAGKQQRVLQETSDTVRFLQKLAVSTKGGAQKWTTGIACPIYRSTSTNRQSRSSLNSESSASDHGTDDDDDDDEEEEEMQPSANSHAALHMPHNFGGPAQNHGPTVTAIIDAPVAGCTESSSPPTRMKSPDQKERETVQVEDVDTMDVTNDELEYWSLPGWNINWTAAYIPHQECIVLTGTSVFDSPHDDNTTFDTSKPNSLVPHSTASSEDDTNSSQTSRGGDRATQRNLKRGSTSRHMALIKAAATSVSEPSQTDISDVGDGSVGGDGEAWRSIPRFADSLAGGGLMGEMLRNFDWSSTSLGPISSWPQSLLTIVALAMASSFPMAIWYGPDLVLLYNDAYAPVAGTKHPWLFGKAGREAWSEIWDVLEPIARGVMERGDKVYIEDHLLFMTRNGYVEESYHTWSWIPIRQENGSVGGLLNPTFEATGRILAERRLKTLRDFSANTSTAKKLRDVCLIGTEAIAENQHDIVFFLLYTCTIDNSGTSHDETKTQNSKLYRLTLETTIGIDFGHPAAVERMVVDTANPEAGKALPWPVWDACVHKTRIQQPGDSRVGSIEGRGWGEPSKLYLTCPIVANDADDVMGVIIIGTSARRPFDADYSGFVDMLTRQVASTFATVKAYEEEVKRAEALTAIDRAKTAFFSSVSHELRTPLTLILGPTDELLRDSRHPLISRHVQRVNLINRNAQRLLKLVNSLLDFSRIEAGRMQATFTECELGTVTADLASVFRSAVEKGGVSFKVECHQEAGRTVWVDRDMWEKIVFNLIGNAFKFTLEGSIKVIVYPGDQGMVFAVQDTGTGIPSHEISRVMERFHRVEGQKGRSHEGSGIGLALTNELVKLHGGKLVIDSEFGKGSTFSVLIPYGTAHLPQDRLSDEADAYLRENILSSRSYGMTMVEEARRWLPSSDDDTVNSSTSDSGDSSIPSNAVSASTRGNKILLADDNSDMRRYVKNILSQWWQVTDVADGQQALDAIRRDMPDIVVSDVMMPVLDGFGLLKVLRSLSETKNLPVILLSARAGEEARVDGLQMGADDYLVKPFSAKELVARVQTHLELGKLRVELERRVAERTQELAESEWRYKVLASMSPVGIFRMDLNGKITYTNERWWEISMHDRDADPTGNGFCEAVHPAHRDRVMAEWGSGLTDAKRSYLEFRFKCVRTGQERWALGETMVEYDHSGNPVAHIGTLTDVTERKKLERERLDALQMAERHQRKRAEEAEMLKQQQELFIDMTCHELRNPLNGIYHNADLLQESLERVQREVFGLHQSAVMSEVAGSRSASDDPKHGLLRDGNGPSPTLLVPSLSSTLGETLPSTKRTNDSDLAYLRSSNHQIISSVKRVATWLNQEVISDLDAVETIALCAQHQKKIADDVLHMSKISMKLLVLAQIDFQPHVEIAKVLRMFDTEARLKHVQVDLEVNSTYTATGVSWVKGDPTRLAQVLINFLTNSIRFMEKVTTKRIRVTIGASNEIPFLAPGGDEDEDLRMDGDDMSSASSTDTVQPPMSTTPPANATHPQPTPPNPVYVTVAIADSGVGMTPEEQTLLFRRFAQASPKTYAEFGGSGLGLFISKRLVELQHGNIRVESTKGSGTTFTFFVRYGRVEGDGGVPPVVGKVITVGKGKEVGTDEGSVPGNEGVGRRVWSAGSRSLGDVMTPSSSTESTSNPPSLWQPPQQQQPQPPPIQQPQILMVEDNVVNQKVLKRLLETLGYSAVVANHGQEALDHIRARQVARSHFDLILMDIEMPVMDGLTAARAIRALERSGSLFGGPARIPIVAVTGNARQEQLDKALHAGMDDYMVKPYVKREMVEKIRGLLGR
ncbi:hypothetical protein DFS34DRAFT_379627 [Phlyctochytrium arcticum]|nr:hypothetical protein DFS34DRAFT_379627 [Phlyctochytrium arcticum]